MTATPRPVADGRSETLGDLLGARDGSGWMALVWRILLWALIGLVIAFLLASVLPTTLPLNTLPGLVGFLIAARIVRGLEGRPDASLGFPLDRAAPRDALLGTALGVAVALVAVALMAVAGAVRWRSEPGGALAWTQVAAWSVWLLLIPAAAEEAMLRGYPFQALAEAKGPAWALAVTSIGFAALHLPNPGIGPLALANLAAAGLFLGVLYLRTGNLWWPTGAHLGWNWAHAFLADLPVSGLEIVDAPGLEAVTRGPAWLSGGPFGPEGSVLATAVVLAAAAWTWRTRRLPSRAGGTSGKDGEDE